MKKLLILASAVACLSFTDSFSHNQDTQRDDAYSRNYGQNDNRQQNQSNAQKDQKSQDQKNNLSASYDTPSYNPRAGQRRDPFGNFNQKTYRKQKPTNAEISYYQKNQYNVPYGGGTSYYENQQYYQDNSKAPEYPNVQQNPYQSPSGGIYSDSIPKEYAPQNANQIRNELYYEDNSKAPYYPNVSQNPYQDPSNGGYAPQNPYQSPSGGGYYDNTQNQLYYQDNSKAANYPNVSQSQSYDQGGEIADNDTSDYYYDPNTGTYTTGMYSGPAESYRTHAGYHPPHGPYCPATAFNQMGGLNTPIPDDASRYNPGLGR